MGVCTFKRFTAPLAALDLRRGAFSFSHQQTQGLNRKTRAGTSLTVMRDEIMKGLNSPKAFILAIVRVEGESALPQYVRQPFQREPDFDVTSVNYDLSGQLNRAGAPS